MVAGDALAQERSERGGVNRERGERGERGGVNRERGERSSSRSGRSRGGFMRLLPVMAALDADGDGEISADEIKNSVAALKKLDKNKDGKLTSEELRPSGRSGSSGRGGSVSQREQRGGQGGRSAAPRQGDRPRRPAPDAKPK